jgi:hypothetical protein
VATTFGILEAQEWIPSRLKIIDKSGRMVPLVFNAVQERLLKAMLEQQRRGLPIRIIVLKARQKGISTAVEAVIFAFCNALSNRKGFVCAHDDEQSEELFRMAQLYQDELPEAEKHRTKYSSKKEIVFAAPHRSSVTVKTAGSKGLKRGSTLNYVHISEVAFYPDPQRTLLSLLQAVPEQPGTLVVMESTANGASGEFYDRWNVAVKHQTEKPGDLSGYLPFFVSWLAADEYTTPLVNGETLDPLDEDEIALQDRGASLPHLKWRRHTIRDRCGGSEDLFAQEYPSTPEEAFRVSGRPAIPMKVLAAHEKQIRPPLKRVRLWRDGKGKVQVEPIQAPSAGWDIWEEPRQNHDYAVGGDVSEGVLSDIDNPASEADYSAGVVLSRRFMRIVAVWHGRLDPDWFGEELLMAAEWYNHAWASPEVNAVGQAALVPFRRRAYPFLYRRHTLPDAPQDEMQALGWRTGQNRDFMIDAWLAACRPSTTGRDPINVPCAALVSEERTFIRRADGKREHQRGCHDDILFAAFIALQIHLDMPRGVAEIPPLGNEGWRGGSGGQTDDFDPEEDSDGRAETS